MNALLSQDRGPYETPIFKNYKVEDYLPALKESIRIAKERLEEIKSIKEPNFENVILALEDMDKEANFVNTIYYNLYSAHASPEHQALASDISAINAEYSNDISLDEKLFQQVKSVYDKQEQLSLGIEEKKLLEDVYKSFVRNGANLEPEKKEQLRDIDKNLAPLSSKFSENVLKAINAFELYLEEKDLEGLPESFVEAAKHAAEEKGKADQYLVSLQAPSFIPFITYSSRRDLREKVWRAYTTKCVEGELSNKEIIKKAVELRHKRAKLLGFSSHADYVLEERMAKSVSKVEDFLENLYQVSRPAAEKDVQEVEAFAKKIDDLDKLMPWDFAYYSEKLKEQKFGFHEEDLKPYFSLEKVIQGAFGLAKKLYGIDFRANSDIDTYHPDVRVFEVISPENQVQGILYADFHPRETKRSGAWMTSYRDQYVDNGENKIPQISIVCNFTKPTSKKPSLLTFDEVQTLFHEFGHALHGLLSKVKYKSLSGTNVLWDFVELPSQFMENFLFEKEVLDLFAEHYETKEKIPAELVEKLKASSKFLAGYASLRQLQFGFLDMAWHRDEEGLKHDVLEFEEMVTEKTRLFEKVAGTSTSVGFSHIFAGGYSAGYYSYKWAEVLDADAYEAFQERGLFDLDTAKSFHDNILSRGGSEDPMELYKRFRGREPDPKALLRRQGLLQK
tara:strand:+ start:14303 stop:16330 length:2028 start_codon:yes stop_codon:yes gene_type:complete